MSNDTLLALAKHYQAALHQIRDESIPFTREWRLANDALQRPPNEPTVILAVQEDEDQLDLWYHK